MINILRNDFCVMENKNSLILKSKVIDDFQYPLSRAEAVYLALHDGFKDEETVNQIAKELFGDDISPLKSIHRFLSPLNNAEEVRDSSHKYVNSIYSFLKSQYKLYKEDNSGVPSPRYLVLCLTQHCSRRCPYCYANPSHAQTVECDALALSQLVDIVNQASFLAVEGILLTGGEPMLHPAVYDLINYALSKNISIYVTTKQRLKRSMLAKIKSNLFHISLSIDSHIPEIANTLTGSKSFYDDMLYNMKILYELGIPYYIKSVITKINADTIMEMIRFFKENHAAGIETDHYVCDDIDRVKPSLMMSVEEKIKFDTYFNNEIMLNHFETFVHHKPHLTQIQYNSKLAVCSGLFSKIIIDYAGNYLLCDKMQQPGFMDLRNIQTQSLWQHWNSPVMNTLRYPPREFYKKTICYNCKKFEVCKAKNSCYAKSIQQYNTYFRPEERVENVCSQS